MPSGKPTEPKPPSLVVPIMTIEAHRDWIRTVEVFADDRRALSASDDNTLKIWDLENGRLLHSLEGHSNAVTNAVVFAGGRRALSGSLDGTLKVWDLENGCLLHSLEGDSNAVMHAVVFAGDRRALSVSRDGTLKVWNLDNGCLIRSFRRSADIHHAVVFADDRRALSASGDGTLTIWSIEHGRFIYSVRGHSANIRQALVFADDRRALSASGDGTLKVWDIENGRLLHSLEGHSAPIYHAVIFAGDRRALSASDDGTLKVWDLDNGRLLHTLEGHSDAVFHAVVYASDRRALSAAWDGTLKVWDLEYGRLLHSIGGHIEEVSHAVVFANDRRAISASLDGTLKVWDLAALEGVAPTEKSSLYLNAKVALIGDSGVGKSGLRLVLEGKPFSATESTHGRYVAAFEKSERPHGPDNTLHCETILWDLAGQPNYRLINQLHLRDVAVALVVFDSRSETDPFAGVRHWNRALEVARKSQGSGAPRLRKYLVAARTDRGTVAASRERVEALIAELGFEKEWFETSAKEGRQIAELGAAIRAGIPWSEMPTVVSTELFQKIKEFLVRTKESGRVLVEEAELFAEYQKSGDGVAKIEQFKTCVDRLRDAGLIRRLAFGDLLLLQPEVLDNYASALINAARGQPDGFGCIREDDVLAGKFAVPAEERLKSETQEKLLLIAMVQDLIAHEIALREPGADGMMLVFPSQFTRENPSLPDPPGKALVLEFEGPVISIYTTLAVRLAQSGTFAHKELWRNAVTYRPAKGAGECGFFLTEIGEGHGRLTIFHAEPTPALTRELFEGFVEEHLRTHALRETITRRRIVVCPKCQTPVSDEVAERRLKRGLNFINCPDCDTRVSLSAAAAEPVTTRTKTASGRKRRRSSRASGRRRISMCSSATARRNGRRCRRFTTPSRNAASCRGWMCMTSNLANAGRRRCKSRSRTSRLSPYWWAM
jgi:small GTP-binding protein